MSDITKDYNEKYKQPGLYWNTKPHTLIVTLRKLLPKNASVLDLGCGEGQNASYLARHGFRVTAVDLSESGIEKVDSFSKKYNVPISTHVADIADFIESCKPFDAIIGINVLQFISANKIQQVLYQIQQKTSHGGYNALASFIAENPEQKQNIILKGRYRFNIGELMSYYTNWNNLKYEEKMGKWETHGETRHRHYKVRFIAQKNI